VGELSTSYHSAPAYFDDVNKLVVGATLAKKSHFARYYLGASCQTDSCYFHTGIIIRIEKSNRLAYMSRGGVTCNLGGGHSRFVTLYAQRSVQAPNRT
jgi:hypothetical protein